MTQIHTFNSIFTRVLSCLCVICLLCCHAPGHEDRQDIKSYYFPFEELQSGLVYEYRSLGDKTLEPEYWLYQSTDSIGKQFLKATLFRPDGSRVQEIVDEYVSNGVLQRELVLYQEDSLGQFHPLEAAILHDDVFPYHVRDSTLVYLYTARYAQPTDGLTITLVRNRCFTGFRDITLFGKEYRVAEFSVSELLETEAEGFTESEWGGVEYYAKEIGLVYYRKEIGPTFTLEYGLFDRYPPRELR